MKISNSKKQMAKIISENDGWIAGDFAAQQDDGEVWFSATKPIWKNRCGAFDMGYEGHFTIGHLIANRHQTILSREEYFHLYPAGAPAPEPVAEAKQPIEQLAVDYRNAKDLADRKQQEADAAKADAEVKLAELVAAGKSLGLVLNVAGVEPGLVITDWRDLQIGDIIEYVDGRNENRVGMVGRVDRFDLYNADTDRHVRMVSDGGQVGWPTKWRFIRRP